MTGEPEVKLRDIGKSDEDLEKFEPKGQIEQSMAEPCERRYCERRVFKDALAEVRVGDEKQEWCPGCVMEEFGLDYSDYGNRVKTPYINAQTVATFLGTFSLMLIIFLIL